MYKVVFQYDDGTEDFFVVPNLCEALSYEDDEYFAYIENFN